jgi:hypothetical protein
MDSSGRIGDARAVPSATSLFRTRVFVASKLSLRIVQATATVKVHRKPLIVKQQNVPIR